MKLDDYENWKALNKASIYGAMIAQQVQEKRRRELAPPTPDDMLRFSEEAGAIVELWEEVTAP
jgi:hypothetical protein